MLVSFNVEPEEEPTIPLDDNFTENFSEHSDSEPEVNNLPLVAPVPNPNPRPTFQGPMPPWVESWETWSQEQDQHMPKNGDKIFYDLSEGGLADKILPILVLRVSQNEIQGRTTLNRILEVGANARIHTICTIRLEDAHERSMRENEALQQELAATRAEVIELRVHHRVYERHLLEMERQVASLRVHPRGTRRR